MTKTLTVILFFPFARLVASRSFPGLTGGLTGRVLVEVCALRSSGDRVSGVFPDIPRVRCVVRAEIKRRLVEHEKGLRG